MTFVNEDTDDIWVAPCKNFFYTFFGGFEANFLTVVTGNLPDVFFVPEDAISIV